MKKFKPGYRPDLGAPLMKDETMRMINGLEDENPGVFGALRVSERNGQQGGDPNPESLRQSP